MGDIIDSREQDSKLLWEDLNEIVEQVNIEFKEYILSPLQIKIGDEFQVVMKDIQSSLKLLYYINTYLMYKKIESRFVIGYGSIETIINEDSANNMLGTGLTSTYEVLNDKKNKNRYRFYIQDNQQTTALLNSIGLLLTEIESKATHRQYEYLYHKVILKESLTKISEKMKITQRTIYGYENRSKYKLFHQIFTSIEKSLK
ncbi:MAG: hypothetical protein COB99_02745 [Sulfurimonas sp.]|nr:MAG: hypothetical protein COB99_02745 [Sulfurimonas sp.]